MSFRIVLLLVLLGILSVVLWFLPREGFDTLNTSAAAGIIERQPTIYPARNVVSAGPSAPSQQAPQDEIIMSTPESAHDPYETTEESASVPQRLRYPERMFQPAAANDITDLAGASGIASMAASQAAHSMQTFAPEFAQNGGEFIEGGIFANDTAEPGAFSSY